jgi:hypothetical protein
VRIVNVKTAEEEHNERLAARSGHRKDICLEQALVVVFATCRLPGSDTPAYLEALPASYGFDPLGLGQWCRRLLFGYGAAQLTPQVALQASNS